MIMNLKSVQKNYGLLSVRERFSLLQSAVCRFDEKEVEAIYASSPRVSYRLPDLHFFRDAVFHLHMVNHFERLSYQDTVSLLAHCEGKHDSACALAGYLYVIETDAWSLVGEEFGFDVKAWRERMAKDYTACWKIELFDSVMREIAFNEDEAREYVSIFNVKKNEVKTLAFVVEKYRQHLRENE